MNTLDDIKSRNSIKRIKKSLGNILVENRKRYNKLQEAKSKTFNEAIRNLNKTLKRSESLLQINHYPQKNDINTVLPKHEINYLKKLDYYNKWHFDIDIIPLPIIAKAKKNNKSQNNIKDKNNFPTKSNFSYLGSLFRPDKNAIIRNRKMSKSQIIEEDVPFYLKGLEPRKNNISASEIVKQSIIELNKRNAFKKYRYDMEEKVGNFVDFNEKYSNYYDFDKKVKKNIKDEMIGLSIPGNVINRSSLGFIRTLQPKNIKIKIKKSVSVPEKTLLPVPSGLAGKGLNYTHITLKNIYNEKNKLI